MPSAGCELGLGRNEYLEMSKIDSDLSMQQLW